MHCSNAEHSFLLVPVHDEAITIRLQYAPFLLIRILIQLFAKKSNVLE
jgi:hypothetical protein